MGKAHRIPGPLVAPILEWRAARIADPLERLRFLRRAADVRPGAVVGAWIERRRWMVLLLAAVLVGPIHHISDANPRRERTRVLLPAGTRTQPESFPNVWQVEKKGDFEVYSNGLRIENRFAVANEPRRYQVWRRAARGPRPSEERSEPVGIVFHATESLLAPFEAGQNRALQRIGLDLLAYVQDNRSYNFLIDRFGRVQRVVRETDAANHAGKSVWADGDLLYVNLNHSFLGVAIEARSRAEGERPTANPAQVYAARVLTEMLRCRYRIRGVNCVTHAQVSVNPANMRIGYHTDWAANFPFSELGLANSYERPLPSLYAFGFGYDPVFVEASGLAMWSGLAKAEERMRLEAAAQGLSMTEYQKILRRDYREIMAALKTMVADEEKTDEAN